MNWKKLAQTALTKLLAPGMIQKIGEAAIKLAQQEAKKVVLEQVAKEICTQVDFSTLEGEWKKGYWAGRADAMDIVRKHIPSKEFMSESEKVKSKSGFTGIEEILLVSQIILGVICWFHGSRCNNINIKGDDNIVYATLSPSGGDTLTVPMTGKNGTNNVVVIKGGKQ